MADVAGVDRHPARIVKPRGASGPVRGADLAVTNAIIFKQSG